MMAIHAGTPHQPARIRIRHVRIGVDRYRNAVGIYRKTSAGRLNPSHAILARIRIDDASNVSFSCELIAQIRAQIDRLCGIILQAPQGWPPSKCGMQSGFRITLHVCQFVFVDCGILPQCQRRFERNGVRYVLDDCASGSLRPS